TDTESELALIREIACEAGAADACVTTVFEDGGRGGEDVAHALVKAADEPSTFRFLYPEQASLREKIETLATRVYGAEGVEYSKLADGKLAQFEELGFGRLPICMAKTQYSLSHDPKLKGRPEGFVFPIQDVRASVGAGF